MIDGPTTLNEAEVLRELEALAPQVRDGFARAGGVSERTLHAIHAEAVRALAETLNGAQASLPVRGQCAQAGSLCSVSGEQASLPVFGKCFFICFNHTHRVFSLHNGITVIHT